jgi:hypothetical protein
MSDEFSFTHHDVFRREGAFAGWPANYGLWSWGRELLTVFAVGKMGARGEIHELDRDHPFVPCQARSLDGGCQWRIEDFDGRLPGGPSLSADEHLENDLKIRPRVRVHDDLAALERPVDFLDPETIAMCARTGLSRDSVSWFYISRSRGRHWDGPFAFQGLELPVAARTDIVPLGTADALFILTTTKSDGKEGRTFCARTRDGGRTFEFVSFVGDEPDGYRIMPSSIRLTDGAIITGTRCADAAGNNGWIEMFTSYDEGASWKALGVAVENTGRGGNPPALSQVDDGRLILVYGSRDAPFGIRMRSSGSRGRTWSEETVIRDDGGTPDIGYPKIARTSGGGLVVVYYFNAGEGRERYIAASTIEPNV